MLTFHANQRPDVDFIGVKERIEYCQAAQIDEDFSVGTQNGVMQGKAGDYLLSDENGLSVVKEADFDLLYEVPTFKPYPGDKAIAKRSDDFHKEYLEEKKALKAKAVPPKEGKPKPKVAKKSSTEIYQKPKEVKKVAPKKVEKKVAPKKVVKKATPKAKKKTSSKKKK